jgi:hypothetical protein
MSSHERVSYMLLGLCWPALIALGFLTIGWDDPPGTLPLLIDAGLQVWLIQLVVTVPAFAALWLTGRLVLSWLGAPSPSVTRLFFWTSLIGSPLAMAILLSI